MSEQEIYQAMFYNPAAALVNHRLSTTARVSTTLRLTENGSQQTASSATEYNFHLSLRQRGLFSCVESNLIGSANLGVSLVTDTGVNSIAKSDVIIRMARNIKAVRGMKLRRVTIRRAD
jgi:hypothetical protein